MKPYFLLFFILLKPLFSAGINPLFSHEERIWIDSNRGRVIKVYLGKNNGILYYNTKGEKKGIFPSVIKALEDSTGMEFEVVETDKTNLKKFTDLGVPDMVIGLEDYKTNEDTYHYIETPIDLNGVLLTEEDSPPIDSQTDLSKKRVVFVRGNSIIKKAFMRYGTDMKVILADSVEDAIDILLEGEGDVYIEDLPEALNYISENPQSTVKVSYLSTSLKTRYYIGIKDSYRPFHNILAKVFNDIDINKEFIYNEILLRLNDGLKLSKKVSEYLNENPVLDVYISDDRDLYPLYYIDTNGEEAGFLVSYFGDLEKMLGVEINFTRGSSPENFNIDPVIVEVGGKVLNNTDFLTTEPYYEGNYFFFNRKEAPFLLNSVNLKDYSLALTRNPILKRLYLNLGIKEKNLKIFPTHEEAIKAVSAGKADLFIGDLRWGEYLMQKHGIKNLKVAGILPEKIAFKFGISPRDEILHLIISSFEKKLPYETTSRKKSLLKNEVGITKDYKLSILIATISLIAVLALYLHLKRVRKVYDKLRGLTLSLVDTLEDANTYKDEDTGTHVKRINCYSELLALEVKKDLHFSKCFIEEISLYASLHDIGKIGIPDSILKKPGRLTEEEFESMKKHSDIGYDLIKKLEVSTVASNIIRHHHEKWNGRGYPLGLSGEDIPIEARIVALADVYDALRQKRVYKEAFSHEKSVRIILSEKGEHFDPQIVEAFEKIQSNFSYIFESN